MMSEKKLVFNEYSQFKDDHRLGQMLHTPPMRGKVLMRDEAGNIILEKDNLIVLRGRTFALEKIFDDTISTNSGYKRNLNRRVVLFKIGNGGADVEAAPFDPFVPNFKDEILGNEIPFITVDPGKNADPEKQANPSIVTALTPAEKNIYYDGRPDPGNPNVIHYYAKRFESEPEWYFDKTNNEVYKRIVLRINTKDARNQYINELALCIAEYDSSSNTYKDIELFSRICFDTESLINLSKQILIEYFIYA